MRSTLAPLVSQCFAVELFLCHDIIPVNVELPLPTGQEAKAPLLIAEQFSHEYTKWVNAPGTLGTLYQWRDSGYMPQHKWR